ncbi:unnamed protein product [Cuscuta epithymum]|uniref:TF-B3 domain-containing protein n=1 Tax=Cuscuta epithymum TaxID=186058 RepID=A0AAV0GGA7_9ASTE|nr:unnamed protein product [Cuscuta epithymum]
MQKQNPSFFKILVGDFASALRLPPLFVEVFGGKLPPTLSLEVNAAAAPEKKWAVKLEKSGEHSLFGEGWGAFVKDNDLAAGDFAVFWLMDNYSTFQVRLYDYTCCEKQLSSSRFSPGVRSTNVDRNVREKRGEEMDESTKSVALPPRDKNVAITRTCDSGLLQKLEKLRVNCYCNLSEVAKRIKVQLNQQEIEQFRDTVFGWILDIEHMPRISGQLSIAFVANYIEEFNGTTEKTIIRFHIGNSVIGFTKDDLAIVTGLNIGREFPNILDVPGGDLCRRYFGSKKIILRQDIIQAMEEYNSEYPRTQKEDGIKLALLYVLAHGFLGNQYSHRLPGKYINLVENLDTFNSYPWGEDVWDDLVTNMKNNAQALKICTGKRVAFPGCMHAIQIWAFETFPSLASAGLCNKIEGKEDQIPRTLRWSFFKKPSIEKFCELIFHNIEFEWIRMVPSAEEIKCIEGLRGREGNEAFQDLRIDLDRAQAKQKKKNAEKQKGKKKETESVLDGRCNRKSARNKKCASEKNKGDCSKRVLRKKGENADDIEDSSSHESEDAARPGKNIVIKTLAKHSKDTAKILGEVKEIQKMQNKQDAVLKKILSLVKEISNKKRRKRIALKRKSKEEK